MTNKNKTDKKLALIKIISYFVITLVTVVLLYKFENDLTKTIKAWFVGTGIGFYVMKFLNISDDNNK